MQFAINDTMKQKDLGLDLNMRRTRKRILLNKIEQVMPLGKLLGSVALATDEREFGGNECQFL